MIERGLKHEINNKNCSLWIIKKELKKENLWNVFHGTVCLSKYVYIFFFQFSKCSRDIDKTNIPAIREIIFPLIISCGIRTGVKL